MKVPLLLLPLITSGFAFVIPDEHLDLSQFEHVQSETQQVLHDAVDKVPSFSDIKGSAEDVIESFSDTVHDFSHSFAESSKNALDEAIGSARDVKEAAEANFEEAYFDTKTWLETAAEDAHAHFQVPDAAKDYLESVPGFSDARPPHHGHGKSNRTVYELISESKYTTKLAKLINDFPDLVDTLNSTKANYTVFAPIDSAFEKIPDDAPKPSKELLEKVLLFHVSPEFYPASGVIATRTIPSLYKSSALGDKPQRLVTNLGLRGLTVNFYSRVVAVNIFGSNGVIHGINSILVPPPKALDIVELLPSAFSTLDLAIEKTGFDEILNSTHHHGGTFFAPSNSAFSRLGLKANAFLFSKYGLKYLKALLKYHVVADQTLYSDAFYGPKKEESVEGHDRIPKGLYHADLPTLLGKRSLGVDIARWGRFIEIKINGYTRVAVSDAIAKDGVIHIPSNVLIPPKKIGDGDLLQWDGKTEMSEEELIERLDPYVCDSGSKEDL